MSEENYYESPFSFLFSVETDTQTAESQPPLSQLLVVVQTYLYGQGPTLKAALFCQKVELFLLS